MPGIVWQNLDPVTMSRLGVDLIREELARRQLDITGSKEELFQRLQADIQQQREATPSVETNESASTAAAPLTLDPATLQSLAMLFQQLPRPATTVTTLPDLSSSIPQFAGLHSHSVNTWLDDVRRVQQLASWDDATTRLIAASKLKGTARDWHLAFGNQYSTWATWSAALKDTFCTELSLIEWQEQVMRVTQAPSESLHQYAFAKLKIIERCPVHLSEAQKIDYLLHGLREQHILAAIAANRPPTVAELFLPALASTRVRNICTPKQARHHLPFLCCRRRNPFVPLSPQSDSSLAQNNRHHSPPEGPHQKRAFQSCPPSNKKLLMQLFRHSTALQLFVVVKTCLKLSATNVMPWVIWHPSALRAPAAYHHQRLQPCQRHSSLQHCTVHPLHLTAHSNNAPSSTQLSVESVNVKRFLTLGPR
ncbi:uncharacterized protein LOC125756558 [Rhipicephalus sanguineus]|uniref:uncharacterized protein LOC125756558 n=1 Tax=Rhipicephalus sanguineus TaxID=34632 RepID=UPI0020C1E0AE|nr:uncharacterized protein LOC125756558 [Rhipicephalus sanguineus]